jgi:protein ImuB
MRTYVRMVVCVYLPRFELVLAAGGPQALAGRALALAPQASDRRVGEASGAAEARGVAPGMPLGEALARCPELVLVAADPLGVAQAWEEMVGALEGIGAAVEPARAGLAYFEANGLLGVHGGISGTIAAVRRAGPSSTTGFAGGAPTQSSQARAPLPAVGGRSAHVGVAPTRFCALAAALAASARRPVIVEGAAARRHLAAQPVRLLRFREETQALVEPLDRLGVRTLGELAKLPRDTLADRFGKPGVLAHRLARGQDAPLCPRALEDRLEESLEVGDVGSGPVLERVLEVLVDRLLARPERHGRTLRAVTLAARLVGEGTWYERVVFRQPLSDPRRVRLALSLRLSLLPAPAEALRLSVERFGPPGGEQRALLEQGRQGRLERLRDAVAQVRAVAGGEAALRALCVDLDSRVPERRFVLAPFPG